MATSELKEYTFSEQKLVANTKTPSGISQGDGVHFVLLSGYTFEHSAPSRYVTTIFLCEVRVLVLRRHHGPFSRGVEQPAREGRFWKETLSYRPSMDQSKFYIMLSQCQCVHTHNNISEESSVGLDALDCGSEERAQVSHDIKKGKSEDRACREATIRRAANCHIESLEQRCTMLWKA